MATIQALGLSKEYGKGESIVKALDGVSLTIEQGEFVAIVGRSGSGKTTMLDCMGLLMRPTSGQILLDGVDAGTLTDNRRAEIRCRRIGFIFQEFNLLPTMSAMENILLPLRYSGGDRKAAQRRASALLEEVGLGETLAPSTDADVRWRTAARGHRPLADQRAHAGAGRRAHG